MNASLLSGSPSNAMRATAGRSRYFVALRCSPVTHTNKQRQPHSRPQHVVCQAAAARTTTSKLSAVPTSLHTATSASTTSVNDVQDALHSLDSSKFSWSSYWYPVHVLDHIDSSRPHAIELLGKQLVLWKDVSGGWNCFDDSCPHRCLSKAISYLMEPALAVMMA